MAKEKVIYVDKGKLQKILTAIVFFIVAVILLASSCFTVDEKEEAVITRFGKVSRTEGAGFHLKIPFVEHAECVEVNVIHKIELGYSSQDDSAYKEDESKMITGDYNIVNVDFFVEYKITDAEKYLYHSDNPVSILANLIQSQVRNVVGSTDIDSVLTTGKSEIQSQVKSLVTAELEEYDVGLSLYDIKIQDSEPPTDEVIRAFKNVETAKQLAEAVINEAKAYENSEIPAARAKADSLLQNAEYLKQQRINEATIQIAMFEARYKEYALNPDITRARMYYEMLTDTLSGVKLYINASDGAGTDVLLPLEDFVSGKTGE